jgi:hypothetical protein
MSSGLVLGFLLAVGWLALILAWVDNPGEVEETGLQVQATVCFVAFWVIYALEDN